jgi:hypothetical protein
VLTLVVSWMAGDVRGGGAKALWAVQPQDPAALRIADLVGVARPDGAGGPAGTQAPIGAMGPPGCVVVGPPGEAGPAGPDWDIGQDAAGDTGAIGDAKSRPDPSVETPIDAAK